MKLTIFLYFGNLLVSFKLLEVAIWFLVCGEAIPLPLDFDMIAQWCFLWSEIYFRLCFNA